MLRRTGLDRRELLTIYSVLLVGGPLVSHGVLFWMIPKVVAFCYMAQVHPLWETSFLPYVPVWFAPTGAAVVEGFFEGCSGVP